jgi:hypothetical protein
MSTWNDKPNDYDHACRIIDELRAEIDATFTAIVHNDALVQALEQIATTGCVGRKIIALNVLAAIKKGGTSRPQVGE